ncbi:MAG TPA: hypothetical protein VGK73_38285 [Polyangiaceae bacterium]
MGADAGASVVACALTRRCAHVGVNIGNRPDVLRITLRHLHDLGTHLDELASPFLPALSAVLADGQRHLIARAAFFSRSTEREPSERQKRGIVRERLSRFPAHLCHRFSEGCEYVPRHLEPQLVELEPGVGDIAGKASRTLPRDEPFDLANSLAASDLEPPLLGARDGDAGELADGGEGEGAGTKRLGCGRKLFERLGDAKFVLGEARSVAEQPLDVLREGAVAQALVSSAPERRE